MDVIDYHEIRTHRREEGTAYAVVSFARKLGAKPWPVLDSMPFWR